MIHCGKVLELMQKNKLFLENELQVIYNQANRNDVSKKTRK